LILVERRLASKHQAVPQRNEGSKVCIIVIVALRTAAMLSRWSRCWQSTTNREWYRRARSAGTPERKRLYRRGHFLVAPRRKNPVLPSSKVTSRRWRSLWKNKSRFVMHAQCIRVTSLNPGGDQSFVASVPGTGNKGAGILHGELAREFWHFVRFREKTSPRVRGESSGDVTGERVS